MSATASAVSKTRPYGETAETSMGPAAIVSLLVFLAHVPLMIVHFQQLWMKPHYQLFPIVLAGAYALLWPLAKFKFAVEGPLGIANKLMAAGACLMAVGMFGESIEGWSFGTPATWVAVGGVIMLAAIALEVLSAPSQSFASWANPSGGTTMVVAAWFIMVFSVFFRAPAINTFSAILVIASLMVTAGGWPLFKRSLPGLAYLLLILPPPFGLDGVLVQKLQHFAARASSHVLDFFGVSHYLKGVTIEVGDKVYMVEQGCSGISSLLSTLACVLFYVLWNRVSWIRGSLLTLSSVFWVLVNNICRIIGITVFGVGFTIFGQKIQMNLSEGLPHQIFGLFLFCLTLFMLWSTDRFLMFVGRSEVPKRRFDPLPNAEEGVETGWHATLARAGCWLHSHGIGAAFAMLVALQSVDLYVLAVRLPYSGTALAKLYEGVDLATMPDKFGPPPEWVRAKELRTPARPAGDPLGQYSRVWDYTSGVIQAAVSLDYPYPEFHDLRVCYSAMGWKFDKTESFELVIDGKKQHCVRVQMTQGTQTFGSLWYCSFDQDGGGVDPSLESDLRIATNKSIMDRAKFRMIDRIDQWKRAFASGGKDVTGVGSILQVQLLIITHYPLDDARQQSAGALFDEGVKRIRAKCIALKGKP